MCELLGMSFHLPATPSISFRGFRRRGKENPDGWGLAFYPDESAQVIKEPIEAPKSPLSDLLKDYVKSRVLIAHVRKASVGSPTLKNTHPFRRELDGKEYVFAHNGTLRSYGGLRLGRLRPIGQTDSEHAFCYLLDRIADRRLVGWDEEDFAWLAQELGEINRYGRFNCTFSDGEFLFCYHDKDGYKGLWFVHRKAPYDRVRLLDEDWCIDLRGRKDPNQTGFVVATKPLTSEGWERFQQGELIVFKGGRMAYSNLREVWEDSSDSPGD